MKHLKYLFSLLAFLVLPGIASAQAENVSFYSQYQLEIVLGVALLVCVMSLIVLVTALVALRAVLKVNQPETIVEEAEESVGFWRKFWNKVNDSVPLAQEATVMTDHEYDGIRELDNRLPPWWLYGFYFTIIFGVIYLLNFHVFKSGDLQGVEYEKEMAQARAQVEAYLASQENLVDETNVTFSDTEADLSAGATIFTSQCAACHGQKGEGGVGPNMTDQYWIHGGSIQDIFKTIKYGVPQKGMISWQAQLSPKEMQQVASFIYTLEGTNPPNPKDPQGDLYEREVPKGEVPDSVDVAVSQGKVMEAGV